MTLDRNGGGPDDSFSIEPQELKQLCTDIHIDGYQEEKLTMEKNLVRLEMYSLGGLYILLKI